MLTEVSAWLATPESANALVVTGRPGSGKSAILGQVVMSSMESATPTLAGHLHARGRTVTEVAVIIAHVVGVDAHDEVSLLAALTDIEIRPMVIAVDAVDEASRPERLVRDLLAPLARQGRRSGLRLLIGSRPGRERRLLRAFDRHAREIDLDSDDYLDRNDLEEYAARLLQMVDEPDTPSTPYRGRPEIAAVVAHAVAARANHSFLVAHLSSLALARADDVLDITAPGWQRQLPVDVDDVMAQYLDRFDAERSRIRDLLLPLAFAEGDGLSDPAVWARVASELGVAHYGPSDVRWLLTDSGASDLLTRTEVGDGHTAVGAFRLFHEALAEQLRAEMPLGTSRQRVDQVFSEALAGSVPDRADGTGRRWSAADHYVRTYLSAHAAGGLVLDDLLDDPSYVASAEPTRLLQGLSSVRSAATRPTAELITRVGRPFLIHGAKERLAYLELAARKAGNEPLAERIRYSATEPCWSIPWARWAPAAEGETFGTFPGYVEGLDIATDQGRSVVAAAGTHTVKVWRCDTRELITELDAIDLPAIEALVACSTRIGLRLVSRHAGGTLAFWNPADGSCQIRGGDEPANDRTVRRLDDERVVTDGPAGLTIWDVTTQAIDTVSLGDDAYLGAVGRFDEADYAIVVHRGVGRRVELWDLTRRAGCGTPIMLNETTVVWSTALGRTAQVPAAFLGFAGDDRSGPASICSIRDWPTEIQRLTDWGWGPLSATMTSAPHVESLLSIGSANGMIHRFAWADGRYSMRAGVVAHDGGIDEIVFADGTDNRRIEVTGGRDGAIRIWRDQTTADSLGGWPTMYGRRTHTVLDTPSGCLLVGRGSDGQLDRWDAQTGAPLGPPPELAAPLADQPMSAIVQSSDGSHLLASGGESVVLFDPITGTRRESFDAPGTSVLGAFDVEGARRVYCLTEDGAMSCYDLDRRAWLITDQQLTTSGERLVGTDLHEIDGELRIFGAVRKDDGSQELSVWSANLEPVRTFRLPSTTLDSRLSCIAAGVVGQTSVVIAMGESSAVQVWDYRSGEILRDGFVDDGHHMMTHHLSILKICGLDVIVSGGYAGALSFWNLSGTVNRVVDIGHATSGWHAIPDSGSLILGGSMGILRIDLTQRWLLGAD